MKAPFIAGAAGGVILSFAFPPFDLDLVAWLAFLPFLWAIERSRAPIEAALHGAAFGVAFFLLDLRWVFRTLAIHGHFSAVPSVMLLVSMVLVLALIPAVFGWLTAAFTRAGWRPAITAAFTWTSLEYVRATALGGFPWDLVGYAQADRLAVAQIADVTGVYGISFLVVLVNAALWELIRRPNSNDRPAWGLVASAAIAVAVTLGYGTERLSRFPTDTGGRGFPVGVLQANIPQEIKWKEDVRDLTFTAYEKLGAAAVNEGARLLIWPETSVPLVFGPRSPGWKYPCDISTRLKVPMLVGAPSETLEDGKSRYYNSAFLVDGPSLRYRYDKIHLVPFGEFMPLSWLLPIGPGIAAREEDYMPGEIMTVMSVEGCPAFSVLICYEAIFPELSRLAVANGARMLVNITNDGWFGKTAAPYQHFQMARIRSIENRLSLIRCANTGISGAFDPAGRVIRSIPLDTEGFFVVNVPHPSDTTSVYSRWGDLFAWGCIATVALVAVLSISRGVVLSKR
ncbi:MAG: apolipoprotein N-acyltransferase [Desulfomonile sp.]|nr:apolipoprotein N-acyltransferase [Desulfomonile sp.]